MAYEPLSLRRAEHKTEAHAVELAERGQSQQWEDLRLKQQRRDFYALNAQLNIDRRSLAVVKNVNTEKLHELFVMYLVHKSSRPRSLTGLTPRAWIKRNKAKTKARSQPGLRKSAVYTCHSVARVPMDSGSLRLLQT